jgi:hypothetical protein
MQIIHGGIAAWDAMSGGVQNQANSDYFASAINGFKQLNFIGDVASRIVESAASAYERFNGSEAMRLARAMTRQVTGMFAPDIIRPLLTIGDLQTAQLTMQRWVMANPVVRGFHMEQRCEGYSDTFTDPHPGVVGEKHYDYRRVMDGVIRVTEDGWEAKHYVENLLPDDKSLSHEDKVDILKTWDVVEAFMAQGMDDPTSPWNAKL